MSRATSMASDCVGWTEVRRLLPSPLTPHCPSWGTTCWFFPTGKNLPFRFTARALFNHPGVCSLSTRNCAATDGENAGRTAIYRVAYSSCGEDLAKQARHLVGSLGKRPITPRARLGMLLRYPVVRSGRWSYSQCGLVSTKEFLAELGAFPSDLRSLLGRPADQPH
jgi:hypothetical protein